MSQSKRVLFIGGNFCPEPTGIGKFNGEMIDQLANRGYHCTVVTSYPYYPYWKVQEPYSKKAFWYNKEVRNVQSETDVPVEVYRCPQYIPKVPSGGRRMLLDLSFIFTSSLKLLQLLFRKKYDYVIAVVPCFQLGLLGLLYKKIRGSKFLYHIQDLQIDAARELKMIKSKFVIRVLFKMEKFILKHADVVSSISSGMNKKISQKCNKEVVLFPNWVDTQLFFPLQEKRQLKMEFGFEPSDRIILYSGAIGEKQGLECLLNVAKSFLHIRYLKFVICGSGPYKEKLKALAEELQLGNVFFYSLQPIEKLNRFLNMADVHLVLQKANASDLVMPSKLTAILSVGGLAIVTACAQSSLSEVVSTHNMGILIPPENPKALKEAIESTLEKDHGHMKENARKYAEEFLTADQIFSKYVKYLS